MKALIISHNPITTHGSMGKTMLTLFSAFKKEELCQLYIYPSLPDIDFCNAYFRVTDKDVLRSYYTFSVKGEEIDKTAIHTEQPLFENERDEGLYRSRKNKRPLRLLLRDAMWRFSRWYTPALRAFIERERPDVIFAAPGLAKFLYRMADKIAKKHNLPLVTYICDDCYFVRPQKGLLGKWQAHALQKTIERHLAGVNTAITISTPITNQYRKAFGVNTETIMTGAGFPIADAPLPRPAPHSFTYLGGIRCNRYRSLADIGEVLDRLNAENGTDLSLNIYTDERDEEILSHLRAHSSVHLHGYVTGEEFRRVFSEAEILLHVEAFDAESIDLVKHSISTKIADSLASGIPLLAYGPASVASIAHLAEHDAALTVTDKSELARGISQILFDPEENRARTLCALALARRCHDTAENSRRVHEILEAAAKQ